MACQCDVEQVLSQLNAAQKQNCCVIDKVAAKNALSILFNPKNVG